ncbi:MAG: Lipoprotein-anchoring transpeptidase [Verrucomicrobia bacterium]|nr:MAG: Lipoprotein-anchoring transpeptidase [Verrucomicrobiota bacterium]
MGPMHLRQLVPQAGLGLLLGLTLGASVRAAGAASKPAGPAAAPVLKVGLPPPPPGSEGDFPRSVTSWLEAQIALAREGISSGSIDGVPGAQTVAALQAWQEREGLPSSGALDVATREQLQLTTPPLVWLILSQEELDRLQSLSPTWLGKSQQIALDYETVLELVAERMHASPGLIQRLNPKVDWKQVHAGTVLTVPSVALNAPLRNVVLIHISLSQHTLEGRDAEGRLVVHFPVSIARMVEKRPAGELKVTVVIADPNYTFDPEVIPESAEGRELGRKLILPPGPNNPVGVAWIGLDRTGYGIHGTPLPEFVGRTESHGCFRLANWDARTMLDLAWVGQRVVVEP